ncbi:hypothetical protein R3P38DRAFT_467135 [Favolaschia claudopus]|uniref:F-box domain-containing protein n=1 Tax=Favolaschia claudopus TaxID=2862362 RepID=A0AAV9ZG07_9AGAR
MADGGPLAVGFTSDFLPTASEQENIKALSRSNSLPSNSVKAQLQIIISAAPAELDRYDAAIRKLHCAEYQQYSWHIPRITWEREALASYAAFCRSILSPIRKLPNELIADIFDLCLPASLYVLAHTASMEEEMNRISHAYLLKLAHVCSHWYRIAMETPKLWSTITVDVESELWDRSNNRVNTALGALEFSLMRGKDYPLNLNACVTSGIIPLSICGLLLRHIRRWKKVYFLSNRPPPWPASASLDQLVSLDFDVVGWDHVGTFLKAPRLTELTFSGNIEEIPMLPWAQLKNITYDSRETTTANAAYSVLFVLRLATNVHECTLYLDFREDPCQEAWDPDSDMQHVTSPVKVLYIELSTEDSDVAGIFQSITLPSLDSLHLYPIDNATPPVWSASDFVALAERSGFDTHLTYLRIEVIVTDVDLVRCLRALDQLEVLDITEYISPRDAQATITDKFLQALIVVAPGASNLSASAVPKLRSIYLRSILDFSDSSFVDMLASRRRAQADDGSGQFKAKLEWFTRRRRDMSSEILHKIAQLVSKGGLIFDSGKYEPEIHHNDV